MLHVCEYAIGSYLNETDIFFTRNEFKPHKCIPNFLNAQIYRNHCVALHTRLYADVSSVKKSVMTTDY